MCLKNFRRIPLTLSWRRSLPYRNQSIDLLCKINRKVFLSWRTPSWKSSGSHWHELEVLLLLSIICRYIRSRLVAPIILFDENNIPKIVFLDYFAKRSTKKSRNLAWRCGVNKQIELKWRKHDANEGLIKTNCKQP